MFGIGTFYVDLRVGDAPLFRRPQGRGRTGVGFYGRRDCLSYPTRKWNSLEFGICALSDCQGNWNYRHTISKQGYHRLKNVTARRTLFFQDHKTLEIPTDGQGFVEVTDEIRAWLHGIQAQQGLLTVFVAHTSASLTIQENSDPDVQKDLRDLLQEIAPESKKYRHSSEGPGDMPAHVKSMLTSVSLSIPVVEGRAALGAWQGIFLIEHRTRPLVRNLEMHFVGSRQNFAS